MNLIPRDRLFGFDRFFDDFWTPAHVESGTTDAFFTPRVDIVAQNDHYEIKAELPGVKKDDLNVMLEDGVLTIDAEVREETSEKEKGKFSRSFNLGGNVQEADISATFEDGLLTLTVPKAQELTSHQRRIEIH